MSPTPDRFTFPIKIDDPKRSSPILYWLIAVVLILYASTASSDIHATQILSGGLSNSSRFGPALLTALITASAVWHWSGRWWVLLASFFPQLTFAEFEPSYTIALPLLGLLLYTIFVPPAEYALSYPDDPPHPKQKWWVDLITLLLLAFRPQAAALSAVVVWMRSANKWLVGGMIVALIGAFFLLPASLTAPLLAVATPVANPWVGWAIFAGIILLLIGIGQRDVLISAASTFLFLPTLSWSILLTPAVVLAVRLPLVFVVVSLALWLGTMFLN